MTETNCLQHSAKVPLDIRRASEPSIVSLFYVKEQDRRRFLGETVKKNFEQLFKGERKVWSLEVVVGRRFQFLTDVCHYVNF